MKKKAQFLALFFGLILIPLIGISNDSINTPKIESAVVHVYRPSKFAGFGWVFNLRANGEKVARVKNGKHLTLNFDPGMTKFSIKNRIVELNLEAGKSYYLRTYLIRDGFVGNVELIEVTESFAKTELGLE